MGLKGAGGGQEVDCHGEGCGTRRFDINAGGQPITLGGVWLLLHLMLRLWFSVSLHLTGVQGSWLVGACVRECGGRLQAHQGCVSNRRSAPQGTLPPFTILEGEQRNLSSILIILSGF